jgi:hypothetical protein
MCKLIRLISPLPTALAVVCLSAGAPRAAGSPIPWQDGLMEVNHYSLEEGGIKTGEIEQRLYGEKYQGRQVQRVVYEMMRVATKVQGQNLIGRVNMDIVFDLQTFESLERTDRYALADEVGRVTYTRTANGFRIRREADAQGIPREPEEVETRFATAGPLVDQMVIVYFVRSLPLEEGHTFEVRTINPTVEEVSHHKGRVAGRETLQWHGQEVEVQRIETSTAAGVTTFYVRTDDSRALLRYISPQNEVYELQPEAAE